MQSRIPRMGVRGSIAAGAAGLALLGAAPARAALSPRCSATHWVGAWGAAPSHAAVPGYSAQTLRMVVTPLPR